MVLGVMALPLVFKHLRHLTFVEKIICAQRNMVSYLSPKVSQELDLALMSEEVGYSVDQLMELAGLSVAQVIYKTYPPPCKILIVCGPGNNGGDGLVAARHLALFGYNTLSVLYPKQNAQNALYKRLTTLLMHHKISVTTNLHDLITDPNPISTKLATNYDIIVDAMFGFSFSGKVREPFSEIIEAINASLLPVISVDVPSGWDVSKGPAEGECYIQHPTVLISLTAPKECIKNQNKIIFGARKLVPENIWVCRHFLGGRFIPKSIVEKFGLQLPQYPGCDGIVELSDEE